MSMVNRFLLSALLIVGKCGLIFLQRFLYLTLFAFFIIPLTVLAHPGDDLLNAQGCHHCWTNCEQWRESYGAIHCHDNCEDSLTPYMCRAEDAVWESFANIQELQSGGGDLCSLYQVEQERFQTYAEHTGDTLTSLITHRNEVISGLEQQRNDLLNELNWKEDNDRTEARRASIERTLEKETELSLGGGFSVGNAALREIEEQEMRSRLSIQDIGKEYDFLRSDLEIKFQEIYNEFDAKYQTSKLDLETTIDFYTTYGDEFLGGLLRAECSAVNRQENFSYPDMPGSTNNCGAGYMLNKREKCVPAPKSATSNSLTNVYAPLQSKGTLGSGTASYSAGIQERTCERVQKRFNSNAGILEKINRRLQKRFVFVCN